jgi:hypothetical protein
MTTHLTKIWWDLNKHKLVEQVIPEAEIYKREPLTDEDITKVIDSMPRGIKGLMRDWDLYEFTRAIEAAHGIKEET